MALKKVITELCPRCGAGQATLKPDGSVSVSHVCPQRPPGPPPYPVTYRPGEVDFVPAVPFERLQVQAETIAELEAGVRGKEGVWPSWVYEAREAIKHRDENLPWLPDLLAALGWQSGTVYDALNAVRRLVEADKVRLPNVSRHKHAGERMGMRSTLEIIIAVKESKPVTEEELRMALLVMSAVDYFLEDELQKLTEAVEADKASAKLRAGFARGTIERMFAARKKDPLEWLGPTNTPGNPE